MATKATSDQGDNDFFSKGSTYVPVTKSSFETFLTFLRGLQDSLEYSDLTLACGTKTFEVHKIVLAGQSSYFQKALASNKSCSKLEVDFDPNLLQLCIDYMYKGSVNIDGHLAGKVASLSQELGISELAKHCRHFEISQTDLTMDNCIEVWETACSVGDVELVQKSKKLLFDNFNHLQITPAFLGLSCEPVKTILSHPDLPVAAPEERLTVALDWVRKDPDSRSSLLKNILPYLPLDKIPQHILKYMLRAEPVFKTQSDAHQLISRAIDNERKSEHCVLITGTKKCSKKSSDSASKDVFIMPTSLASQSKVLTSIPVEIHQDGHVATTVSGNVLYVSGIGKALNEVWAFDMQTGTWAEHGKLCEPRHKHTMVEISGDLYVLGGGSSVGYKTLQQSVEINVKGSTEWRKVGKLKGSDCNNTCGCKLNDKDILLFGVEDKDEHHTLSVYSTESNEITHSLSLSEGPQWVCGVMVVEKHIIMMSSINTYTCQVSSLYDEKPELIEISSNYKIPNWLCASFLSADSGFVLLLGGDPRSGSLDHFTYRASVSDVITNSDVGWEKISEAWPHGLHDITAAAVCCSVVPSALVK